MLHFSQTGLKYITSQFIAGVVFSFLLGSDWVMAQETSDDDLVQTRTQKGLHFELPEDWPVEKRNGVLAPIPLEEYLSRKFKGVDGRIEAMEKLLNGMDLRLRVMEEKIRKNQGQGLRSGG